MNALAHDIRKLIADRIHTAPAADLFSIAQSICANDEGALIHGGTAARWTALEPTRRFTRYDLHGNVVQSGGVAVYDSETDLTWAAAPLECGSVPWKDALKACSNFRLLGKDDWRAPTVKERVSIVDYSKIGPALYSQFTAVDSYYEWTSTPDAESPSDYAWVVCLRSGDVVRGGQAVHGYVRAVRAGQSLSLGL
jgi:hypothetical protein